MKNKKGFCVVAGGILVMGLMWLLASSQGLQAAGRTAGAKVLVVTGPGSERFTGEVIGIRVDAVVIGTEGGETRTIAIKDISSVRVYRRSAVLPGSLLGALAGGAAGLAIGSQWANRKFLGGIMVPVYTAGGAALGGLAGALTGGLASADKTYDLTRMSPLEQDKFMGKLRKMARVKNYQ
jgi:hypothetical protein